MTEEKADQIIRCVKECWWRLIVFFTVELFFVALVIYGWPQGDWSIGWGAIGAVGTLVTGGAAFFIGWQQQSWFKRTRDSDYYKLIFKLRSALSLIEKLLALYKDTDLTDKHRIIAEHYLPKAHSELKEAYESSQSSLLSKAILEDINILIVTGSFFGLKRQYANKEMENLDALFAETLIDEIRVVLPRVLAFLVAEEG